MKQNIFYYIAFGFLGGVLFSSFFKVSFATSVFLLVITVAVFTYIFRKSFIKKVELRFSIFFLVSILSFLVGVWRFEIAEKKFEESALKNFESKTVSVVGKVLEEPSRKGENITFRVKVYSVSQEGEIIDIVPEYINVRVLFFNNVNYGDGAIVTGKISAIKNFTDANNDDNSGAPFDYVSYLKAFGVSHEITFPKVEVVEKDQGNPIIASFLRLKEKFNKNIEGSLSEPDASLVSGMVISGKKSLDKDLQDNFIKTGIIHIVVLSGYNIAIVISFLISAFSFTGRKMRLTIVFIGVLIFVIISGASPPVVRAAIMAISILSLKLFGREGQAFRVLLFTAFLMILQNPYLMAFSSSFTLSFMAVFAIIYVSPLLRTKLSFVTEKYKMREIVGDTLGVQIFLLPFLVYKMGIISLVALPVNILVLPIIPPIMFLGFIIGVFGFIPYAIFPFTLLVHFLIKFMLFVVKVFVALPFSSITIPYIPLFIVLLFYIGAIAIIYFRNKSTKIFV